MFKGFRLGSVRNENSVQPLGDANPPSEPQNSNSLRPRFTLVNEIRGCAAVQQSTVHTEISKRQG
jgi:hypothetical protein